MTIKPVKREDIAILPLKGTLLGEPEVTELRTSIYQLLEECHRKFVLDLGGLRRMHSIGLGAMISALTSVKNRGSTLLIANANQKTGPIFVITKVGRILKLYEPVDRAVASLKRQGGS